MSKVRIGGWGGWGIAGVAVTIVSLMVLTGVPSGGSARPIAVELSGVMKPAGACAVGAYPGFPGYDPVNHDLYVPDLNNATVTVLDKTCSIVGWVPLAPGSEPVQAAFDPMNNVMYVTDAGLNRVYGLSGLAIVSVWEAHKYHLNMPWGIVYDPEFHTNLFNVGGGMIIANSGGDTLSAVLTYENVTKWDGLIPVGNSPVQVLFDPGAGALFVTNIYSDNVTVVNAQTAAGIANVTVGKDPYGLAYSSYNEEVYVANSGGTNVTVLYANGATAGDITGFSDPNGVAFDQATERTYVTNFNKGTVIAIGGKYGLTVEEKYSTSSGDGAFGATFDPADNDVYVTGAFSNTVYVLPN
jgi:YVTN family beta-propeller protein